MNDLQLASFQIISAVGTAKSCFIEAVALSEKGDFEAAQKQLEQGKEAYKRGHDVHFKLLQQEAEGEDQPVSVLLVHAEDQLMSAETIQILAQQMIAAHQRLYELEHK